MMAEHEATTNEETNEKQPMWVDFMAIHDGNQGKKKIDKLCHKIIEKRQIMQKMKIKHC